MPEMKKSEEKKERVGKKGFRVTVPGRLGRWGPSKDVPGSSRNCERQGTGGVRLRCDLQGGTAAARKKTKE